MPKYILYFILFSMISSCAQNKMDLDILIINGSVYNGFETGPKTSSIGITDGKIVFIGNENKIKLQARKTIDATGLIVAPGFIDPHTHADRDLVDSKQCQNLPFLFQGVTTVIIGNDGESFYPTSKNIKLFTEQGIGTNVVMLTGHGTIREQVMGNSDKLATAVDISNMQKLIQDEMNAGAFGMSTGLFYAPGSYSNAQEVIALAKTVAKNNGIYDTHLRDESSYTVGLIPAIEEAIAIGREAKLPVHISHIKCLGADVWNQSIQIIELIENAQKAGIDVTANQYPYDASATGLQAAIVPRWAESGGKDSLFIRFNNKNLKDKILEETKLNIVRRGGAEKLLIVKAEDSILVGKNLLEIAQLLKTTPEEATFQILKSNYIRIASFNMNGADITNFMKQKWVVTGSDGNTGHPRKYGTFPRKYHKYVKIEKVIDISSFIKNSTSATADIFKIKKRGKLLKNYFADIIIFNPETFKDVADYTEAFKLSEGLKYCIVNGKLSIEDGKYTNQLNGEVLEK